jgi:hypothetical protein
MNCSNIQLWLGIYIVCDVLEGTRTWWVGRGINGGPAELEGGATVRLCSIKAFALATVVHCTRLEFARQLCQKLVAVLMLGVFVDASFTPGPSNL